MLHILLSTAFLAPVLFFAAASPSAAPDLPLDRVVDASVVEEVLRERR